MGGWRAQAIALCSAWLSLKPRSRLCAAARHAFRIWRNLYLSDLAEYLPSLHSFRRNLRLESMPYKHKKVTRLDTDNLGVHLLTYDTKAIDEILSFLKISWLYGHGSSINELLVAWAFIYLQMKGWRLKFGRRWEIEMDKDKKLWLCLKPVEGYDMSL